MAIAENGVRHKLETKENVIERVISSTYPAANISSESMKSDKRGAKADDITPVSYTHLDVYKRQRLSFFIVIIRKASD